MTTTEHQRRGSVARRPVRRGVSGVIRSSRAPEAVLVALVVPSLVVACGTDREQGAESVEPCPSPAIWDRDIQYFRGGPLAPDIRPFSTADEALQALAEDVGTELTVRATRPVDATAIPGDELEVDVVDERGDTGTYVLGQNPGGWAVSGGEGCGAPPPPEMTRVPDDCPTPTYTPGGPTAWLVQC